MDKPFKHFLPETKDILIEAEKIAAQQKQSINSGHILAAIVKLQNSVAFDVLLSHGADPDKISISLSIARKQTSSKELIKKEGKNTIKSAMTLAKKNDHKVVAPEHLLMSICTDKKSVGYKLLKELDIKPSSIKKDIQDIFDQAEQISRKRAQTQQMREISPEDLDQIGTGIMMPEAKRKKKKKLLPTFSTDLVKQANNNKLDPLIGREEELSRVIKILNRRTKNNPVLVGEAGVGKTAIAEGLAQRIADGKVPLGLKNKKLLSLDLSLILAGTKYRGQFEDRIKKIVDEIKADPNIILFLDEIHTVAGAGAAEGSIDAANIIKPALAKGDLRLVGATTTDEYRKHIEKDNALERRLQMVKVDQPEPEDTEKIIKGLRKNYENHHRIKITDEAVKEAVKLSDRYISDRMLPDKAIDLVDEAASAKSLENPDKSTKAVAEVEEKIQKSVKAKEKAVVEQNYEEAAKQREQELKLKSELMSLKKPSKDKQKNSKEKINGEDIAKVLSEWTGIPVTNLIKEEKKKYQELEKEIKKKIVGQDDAVKKISRSIRRSRTGISQANRPIGSFVFLGPTGVGKTELAKVLAKVVFEKEDALIRVDMSEFMEKHNVSKMVGAPPGYVGYEEGGKLTKQVKRNPYSVILLDELEKAHSDVQNILLQILEDGFITDGQGKKVDFSNTLIIMTSNIGTKALSKEAAVGFKASGKGKDEVERKYREMKDQTISELKDRFRPEFLNRIDDILVFKPLTKKVITEIVKIKLKELETRLEEQKGLSLDVSKAAINYLAKKGYDPDLGARPVRRVISKEIEDEISEKILSGDISENQKTVKVKKQRNKGLLVS